MQVRSKFVVSLVSVLGALACGDDDSGTGSTGGVSDNAMVGNLSESEARAFCRSLESKLSKLGEVQTNIICVLQSGAAAQGNTKQCETATDECKDKLESGDPGLDCDGEDGETGGVSGECGDVTVGELNDCLDATAAALGDIEDKITCSLDLEELQEVMTAYEVPAACTAIETKCPDVADMDTPGGSPGVKR